MITRGASRKATSVVAVTKEAVKQTKAKPSKSETKPKEDCKKTLCKPTRSTSKKQPKQTKTTTKQKADEDHGPAKKQKAGEDHGLAKKQKADEDHGLAKKQKADDDCGPAKKKTKLSPIKCDSNDNDPIIAHLKEVSKSYTSSQQGSIDAVILDQIALEGLSGTTLNRLFQILDAVFPNLNCLNDADCQSYVWYVILNRYLNYPSDIGVRAFYLDPEKKLIKTTAASINAASSRGIIIEKQITLSNQTIQRVSKIDSQLYPVQDEHIMGSCANYLDRIDITQDLIDGSKKDGTSFSMYDVDSQYKLENIFFVAGQTLRHKAIFPNWADPNINIMLREYCALELIGKSRTLGTVFPNDKAFGRYRIMLLAKKFITQYQQTNSSPIEHHLKRFQSDIKLINSAQSASASTNSSSADDEGLPKQSLSRLCCNPHKFISDRSTLTMVYDVIAYSDGLTQLDIRKIMNLPKFHVRNHLKNLITLKMICSHTAKNSEEKAIRVYKTAHKTTRKNKPDDELANATGIMAKWDKADLRAKKIIGHKRSSFSQAEDSLLILCRITSILIEPDCRLSWCVHKRLIRDLLHKELIESHDKTSDACLRRIKYLKRLPNNIMSINELTAELSDDLEISKLIRSRKVKSSGDNEARLNKLFAQVLNTVRTKIPHLLGIATATRTRTRTGRRISLVKRGAVAEIGEKLIEIEDHEELNEKYELVDCQSVASIQRSPTYEQPKNVVDVKFDNACLVTMAFALSSCFAQEDQVKREHRTLLDKFFSGYHDKLISSVLSKLNKRSLLTRKCPAERAALYKPKTKMSLKLNQSVLFLLNRYHSSSLMQLAHPISQLYTIELSESNEMSSIALLTSLCCMSSFELNLKLKIPTNVVGIDQGNENFKSLCDKADDRTREVLARFLSRCGESLVSTPETKLDDLAGICASTSTSSVPLKRLQPKEVESSSCGSRDIKEIEVKLDSSLTMTMNPASTFNNKMDDSRRALFLLRHELKAQALDKCGSLSDCLIVQPCNVSFSSEEQVELRKSPFDSYLELSKPFDLNCTEEAETDTDNQQQQQLTNWLVKSYRFQTESESKKEEQSDKAESEAEGDLESSNKVAVQYHARLWKSIDGSIELNTLFKFIEALLSYITVFPGIELDLLQREFSHLMPNEHLSELLELMQNLELIFSHKLRLATRKPRLFGCREASEDEEERFVVTYEPSPGSFIQYCQLMDYYK